MDDPVCIRKTFQRAYRRGAHADDTSTLRPGLIDRARRFFIDPAAFRMHMVIQDVFFLDRPKGSQADMQCHKCAPDPLLFQGSHQLFGKMQSCRRRGCRSLVLCVYRLITLSVFSGQFMRDIGRQRHLTERIQHFLPDALIMKLHQTIAVRQHFLDHRAQRRFICLFRADAKDHLSTGTQFFPGLYQALPYVIRIPFQQQDLYRCSRIFFQSQQPGRDHAGIIKDQAVACIQVTAQLIKMLMCDTAALTVQDHQT